MAELGARRRRLWELHDFSRGRGLEVGPLYRPVVRKDEADVRYVDIRDQAGLRAYYAGHEGLPVEKIPEIDYPLTRPDGRIVSLAEACREGAPFDWVVASHVVEHVPDVIGWLAELAGVARDGAALVLVVPDRRYSFDAHRPPTTVGAMVEAHLLGAVRPGVRAVYDHYSTAVRSDARERWAGAIPGYDARHHGLDEAQRQVQKSLEGYVDCHVWLFTPDSFVEQLHELRLIGRSEWYVEQVSPTRPDRSEFMVRLRRLPRGHDPGAPVEGEVLPTRSYPDWLDEPGRVRRVERLEKQVAELERRLAARRARIAELRAELRRQRAPRSLPRRVARRLRRTLVRPAARRGS